MGSQRVVAITSQIGSIKTNPNNLSPDTSRPILQRSNTVVANSTTIIEQRASIRTAFQGVTEFSRPIEQRTLQRYISPNDAILEQRASPTSPSQYVGPVEQFEKVSNNSIIEQRGTVKVFDNPIEQLSARTNNTQITQANIIQLIFPPCFSIKNPVNTNILWRLQDLGFPFDAASLIFIVNGIEVQNRDSFTITPLVNGLEFFYDPPDDFPFNSLIEIFVQIRDTADPPNQFNIRCSWFTVPDTRAPMVVNFIPTCGSSDVGIRQTVSFDVVDIGDGVDPDSIVLSIEGLAVCSGITMSPVTIPGSGTGYHVTWEHFDAPFRFDSNISAAVQASDLAEEPNSVLFVCTFNTEKSKSPEFINFDPAPCESFVDTETGLSFEVYGVEHGVDIATLEVLVDNKARKVYVRPRVLRTQ